MKYVDFSENIAASDLKVGRSRFYLLARPNFVMWAFPLENVNSVEFSETIAACDMKVGRRSI